MPYVDPSRVQMALRYAELAERSPAEREPATEDLRVFLATLWADATARARARYSAAAARSGGALPWAAMTSANSQASPVQAEMSLPGEPVLRGPAVVELLVGQEDPEDEGVPGYRLSIGEPRAEAITAALYGWRIDLLRRTAEPSGWRLEATEETEEVGDARGAEPTEDLEPEVEEAPEEVPEESEAGDEVEAPEGSSEAWKVGALLGGFAALGFVAWRWG